MPLPITPHLTVIEAPTRPKINIQILPMVTEELDKLYRVIILNDDKTTFQFVIESLMGVFGLEQIRAETIAWETHQIGEAYVVTLPYEEAKDKVVRVKMAAREQDYPLDFVIEPEE